MLCQGFCRRSCPVPLFHGTVHTVRQGALPAFMQGRAERRALLSGFANRRGGRTPAWPAREGGSLPDAALREGLPERAPPPGGRLAAPSLAEAKERGRPHRFFCRKGVLPPRFGKRMYFKAKIGNAAIERRCRRGRPAGRRKPGKGKGGRRAVSLSQQKQQRIRAGELIDCCFTEEYPGIGRAMVLVFDSPPFLRPVRPHAWALYTDVLQEWSRQRGGDGR